MEFSKPEAYLKQASAYLKGEMDEKAYELSMEFAKKYPGQLMAHILLAESAFRTGRLPECKSAAKKGLGVARSEADIRFCAMIFCTACFQLKDYSEGYKALQDAMGGKHEAEMEEALLVFSLAMGDEEKAMLHLKNLMALSRQRAMGFMKSYVKGLRQGRKSKSR